ncbi:hypothetical protein [Streptosporangium carneum]|uniref:hypothetical protein n=1 Tax=Streptosporangium carneum TaxID=47481 RepID=UPI0022F314F4|nr:hypothetical protein [Streptosporangium carneum]
MERFGATETVPQRVDDGVVDDTRAARAREMEAVADRLAHGGHSVERTDWIRLGEPTGFGAEPRGDHSVPGLWSAYRRENTLASIARTRDNSRSSGNRTP